MNISTETREILRNYKAVINARRREMGQKPLTTAQIVDEICDFVANQQAVFLGGHYILHRGHTAGDSGYRAGGHV
ncbi:hypothetical protein [Escherichia coli]|uniref:hypothetical protein n=1 Tax=Escherichia coli TaxID=562 RepID=UPI000935AE00|nr:hypothetical protein [Escherichia coli]